MDEVGFETTKRADTPRAWKVAFYLLAYGLPYIERQSVADTERLAPDAEEPLATPP